MYNISIFKHENLHNVLCLILISLLPLSLLAGSLIINIFSILIPVVFLFESFRVKNFNFLKSSEFLILIIFWIFLLINCFLSTKFENSFARSFGFLRFILLVFALRYYFTLRESKYQKLIFTSWILLFLLVTFDLLFESYFGFNTLGFKNEYTARLSGFLDQELKIGGYYFGFILISLTYILLNHRKYFYISFFTFILIAMLIGERANLIKILLMSLPFLILLKYNYKIKIIYFVIVLFLSMTAIFFYKPFYKERFYSEFIENNSNFELSLTNILSKSEKHHAHYIVAYRIYKDNYFFGVGLKNFRNESWKAKYRYDDKKNIFWSTHPHQIHLEFLSETGSVGYLVFVMFFIFSIIIGFRNYYYTKNLYSLCGTLFITATFLPLIPSGSFFTTYAATIFWINYSLISLKKI